MRIVTFMKNNAKRLAVVGCVAAAAAVAAGTGVVLTSVGTMAAERTLPICSVERGDGKIALTFDAIWENSDTDELIDILDDFDAKATFFVTGDWCERYPEDVQKLFEAGHEVQNLSDEYIHAVGMNVNDLINDTREAGQKIEAITGEAPLLYRPPYGEFDDSVLTTVEGMGYKIIEWSIDSTDDTAKSAEEIKQAALNGVESGSILHFHTDTEYTAEALPQILTQLKSDGFEFVPVGDLIYRENYSIDSDGVQVPYIQSDLDINSDNVVEVMAQYSDKLAEIGFTPEQQAAAAEAIKNGAEIPDEVYAVIAQITNDGLGGDFIETDEADIYDATEEAGLMPDDYSEIGAASGQK